MRENIYTQTDRMDTSTIASFLEQKKQLDAKPKKDTHIEFEIRLRTPDQSKPGTNSLPGVEKAEFNRILALFNSGAIASSKTSSEKALILKRTLDTPERIVVYKKEGPTRRF